MTANRQAIRRIVIKLGTGVLTKGIGEIDREVLRSVSGDLAKLRADGAEVCLVSSGAVGMGMKSLGFTYRPSVLADLQACAAIGQIHLMNAWRETLGECGLEASQILLTREDVRHRERHLAVRSVIERIFAAGKIIPIINENDSVSTAEIRFGDNDVLSALVASLLHADLLLILSTAPGLIDPASGKVQVVVGKIDERIEAMAGGTTSQTAVGGMVTKLAAAKIANRSGCGVFIGEGRKEGIALRMLAGEPEGTFFVPEETRISSRKRWLAFFQRSAGSLVLDPGAVRAVKENGRSLLAKGILGVEGTFSANEVVALKDAGGNLIAKGIVAFGNRELQEIKGMANQEIALRFPDQRRLEVIHRDDLVLNHD
ncbi:MAG: glutamate 5-kinase [Puniceicoccaceae bacterium]